MKIFIIAEAGVNHNGSLELAKDLVDAASDAGADAVKFQTFVTEAFVTRAASLAAYQKKSSGQKQSQFDMLKKLELNRKAHHILIDYCNHRKIKFLSSPFGLESIEFLDDLGLEIFKIPSGEITNLPYLRKIGSLKKRIILSTGMSNLGEIEDALSVLVKSGTALKKITVLHCNTEYPTPMKDVNLQAMLTIKSAFGVDVGYSDHTLGIEVPIAAVALGATVIEKHFTLSHDLEGPDHKASLIPNELKAMIVAIRNIEKALGSGRKKPSISEIKNRKIVRKSIVAAVNIKKGEKLTEKNLTVKRPGSGISPFLWDQIVGRIAQKDYKPDEFI